MEVLIELKLALAFLLYLPDYQTIRSPKSILTFILSLNNVFDRHFVLKLPLKAYLIGFHL